MLTNVNTVLQMLPALSRKLYKSVVGFKIICDTWDKVISVRVDDLYKPTLAVYLTKNSCPSSFKRKTNELKIKEGEGEGKYIIKKYVSSSISNAGERPFHNTISS